VNKPQPLLFDFEPRHQLRASKGRATCSCGQWKQFYECRWYPLDGQEDARQRLREYLKESFYKHVQHVRDAERS
jgi:hypothetical protein